jgi:hypothetical protein
MKKALKTCVLLVALAGVVIIGIQVLFPSPEKVIKKRLLEMARLASFDANEAPLAKLVNSQKLGSFVTENVQFIIEVPGRGEQSINSREELVQGAAAARSQLSALKVEFPDVVVHVASDKQTAIADVTLRANVSGQRDLYIQELSFSLERTSGDWRINRIQTTRTLR